jgi:hypothetical protein
VRAACTTSRLGRSLTRSFSAAYFDRVRGYQGTPAYEKRLRKRKVWVEPLFGEAKQWHGLRRFRLRRLPKVNTEALLTAAGQNLKRLLQWRGWGRRPWPAGPSGPAAAAIPPRHTPRPPAAPPDAGSFCTKLSLHRNRYGACLLTESASARCLTGSPAGRRLGHQHAPRGAAMEQGQTRTRTDGAAP